MGKDGVGDSLTGEGLAARRSPDAPTSGFSLRLALRPALGWKRGPRLPGCGAGVPRRCVRWMTAVLRRGEAGCAPRGRSLPSRVGPPGLQAMLLRPGAPGVDALEGSACGEAAGTQRLRLQCSWGWEGEVFSVRAPHSLGLVRS